MPEIILDSVSIDDFISDESKIKNGQKELSKVVEKFNLLKPDIVVMCCNTAHIIYPEINKLARLYFPSLINLVNDKLEKSICQNIGILATSNTLKFKLYQDNSKKIFVPDLDLQNILEENIRLVINSDFGKINHDLISQKINKFIKQNNLDGLVLGCTEIPVFFPKIKLDKNITIFNSSEILANHLISFLNVKI
ncbi:Aspartate racemase [bioreactor metagenome]|uniref:Aspartate racemase n=1 Tax=bioreactor metagenome TaxID=1076179 RepID=A0A644ZE56_9ZZZZ